MVRSISTFGSFHSCLPVLESLCLADEICSTSQLFNLVCSLPILEDLTLVNHESGEIADDNTIFQPSTVPPLSGALNLCLTRGMEPVACQLRELPDGVRFRKLNLALSLDDDLRCTATIVEACSGTLESIKIQCPNYSESLQLLLRNFDRLTSISALVDPTAGSIDFSKAIKLKEVLFQFQNFRHAWVAMALQTLTTKHTDFRKVTILMPLIRSSFILSSIRPILGEKFYNQWMDLDRVLIRLWESNAIHVQVTYCAEIGGGWSSEYIESLFPEMKKRGLLEMVYDRDLF